MIWIHKIFQKCKKKFQGVLKIFKGYKKSKKGCENTKNFSGCIKNIKYLNVNLNFKINYKKKIPLPCNFLTLNPENITTTSFKSVIKSTTNDSNPFY